MINHSPAYCRRHCVRHIESNLYAGASKHFTALGIAYNQILQWSADAEEKSRCEEGKNKRWYFIRRQKIYHGHEYSYYRGKNGCDE